MMNLRETDRKEKRTAAMHPLIMAGREVRMDRVPCLQRRMQEIRAAGMKNNRTIPRAVKESIPNTRVSQRISRLPPPMPNPVKNPRRIAIKRFIATGTVHLPK